MTIIAVYFSSEYIQIIHSTLEVTIISRYPALKASLKATPHGNNVKISAP